MHVPGGLPPSYCPVLLKEYEGVTDGTLPKLEKGTNSIGF